MDLLFKREQTQGKIGRVHFKLWGKLELTDEEQEIVTRYRFDDAILIEAIQPTLIRNTILMALGVFFLGGAILAGMFGTSSGLALGALAAGGAGYWYFNEKRETIFVKDLLHDRYFDCTSVIELARK